MKMKLSYKIALIVLGLELIAYFLLFHCGIVLPFINPSIEEYNKTVTSFPRDYGQWLLWMYIHYPMSALMAAINENLTVLAVLQYPLIVVVIGKILENRRVHKK